MQVVTPQVQPKSPVYRIRYSMYISSITASYSCHLESLVPLYNNYQDLSVYGSNVLCWYSKKASKIWVL